MDPVDDTEPNPNRLYTIGQLARRTELPVKTIRFYSDSGVVPPTDRTHSGYRLYDVAAITKLELVRTLRELGAGLDEVQRVLSRETTLAGLAAAHLALLEDRMRLLRTRRAVLRTIVNQDSTTDEVTLMHKLAHMSDEERNRLIDELWDETTEGLNVDPEFIEWMRSAKPNLPEDPSSAQVEAWIELAELVQDPGFRQLVRDLNVEQAAMREQDYDTEAPAQEAWAERPQEIWAIQQEINAAHEAGAAPGSVEGQTLARRFVAMYAEDRGERDSTELRNTIADRFENHDPRLYRYWELLGTINGWDTSSQTLSTAATRWLTMALRTSAE